MRGPHEHVDQADLFCFTSAGNFKLHLWDNREDSPTYRNVMTMFLGADNSQAVIIPNRLFMGEGKEEEIDEIRHEDDPGTIFRIEDQVMSAVRCSLSVVFHTSGN